MKKLIAVLSILVFLFILCSCGHAADEYPSVPASYAEKQSNMSSDIDKAAKSSTEDYSQKLIKTYNFTLQTLKYEDGMGSIKSLVNKYNGYFSGSEESSYYDGARRATLQVRIPSENLDSFAEEISGNFNVIYKHLSTDEVTDTYYGLKAEYDSLIEQEARINELMKQADSLETLIKLDNKLTEIRQQINYVSSKIQYYDKAVAMSFVYIELREVVEYETAKEPTFFEKIGDAFAGSGEAFVDFINGFIVVLIYALPFIVLFGGIAFVIVFFSVRASKKRKAKAAEQNKTE